MQFKDTRHRKKRKDLKIFKKRNYKPEKPNPGAAQQESSEESDDSDGSDDSTCRKSFARRPIENNWARYEEPEPIEPKTFSERNRPSNDSYKKEIPPSEQSSLPERDRTKKSRSQNQTNSNAGQKEEPKRESRQKQSSEKSQPQRQSKSDSSSKPQPKPQRQTGASKQQSKDEQSLSASKQKMEKPSSREVDELLSIETKLSGLNVHPQQKGKKENNKSEQSAAKHESVKPVLVRDDKEDLQAWLDDLLNK